LVQWMASLVILVTIVLGIIQAVRRRRVSSVLSFLVTAVSCLGFVEAPFIASQLSDILGSNTPTALPSEGVMSQSSGSDTPSVATHLPAESPNATQNTATPGAKGTEVELLDTKVLYDGTCYAVIRPSDNTTFSMGSDTYDEGFEIWDDHSLFGEGDGFALFDLKKQYAKLSLDVGKTNDYDKDDVILKVYLDDKYVTEHKLSAQSPPVHMEVELNYASSLKLEISGGSKVKYGFANAKLTY